MLKGNLIIIVKKKEGNEGNFRHLELKFSNSVPTAPVFLFPAPTGRLTIPCGR